MKTSQLVFACYEKACAPPPAGKGGSLPSRGGGLGPGGGQITIGRHKWDLGKPKQADRNPTGGTGGSSVPAGTRRVARSSDREEPIVHAATKAVTRSAFRGAQGAITARKGGGAITTSHNGKDWSIVVHDANNRELHRKHGRGKDPESALNDLVNEYYRHA